RHAGDAQRLDGLTAGVREPTHRDHSRLEHRDLHDDIVRDLRELLTLAYHTLGIHGHYLGRDGTVHERADLLEDVARVQVPRLFRQQRGVGRDAIDQPGLGRPADVFQVCRIEKKLHGRLGLGVEVGGITHRYQVQSLWRSG